MSVAKVEAPNLLERATIITSNIDFKDVASASEFLNSRKITQRKYRGDQLSVKFDSGTAMLGIKGEVKHSWFPLRDSGMESLLQKMGMGLGSFSMDICDDSLIEHNINYLLKNMNASREFTVILDKNQNELSAIKAVMSDVYHTIPHQDVLNIISRLNIETKVHTLSLTKDFFRISITNPGNKVEPIVGDISSVGVDLLNSENGRSSLSMGQFLYRYFCSNGASRVDESMSIRSKAVHRGNLIGRLFGEFSQGAKHYLTDGAKAMENNLKKLIQMPVTESFVNKVNSKIEVSIGKKGAEKLVEEWGKSIGTIPCSTQEFAESKMSKYQDNRYDFAQIITRTAHRDYSGIKRLGLEKIGGWIYGTSNN